MPGNDLTTADTVNIEDERVCAHLAQKDQIPAPPHRGLILRALKYGSVLCLGAAYGSR